MTGGCRGDHHRRRSQAPYGQQGLLAGRRAGDIMTPGPKTATPRPPRGRRRARNDQLFEHHRPLRGGGRAARRHHPYPRSAPRLPNFTAASAGKTPPRTRENERAASGIRPLFASTFAKAIAIGIVIMHRDLDRVDEQNVRLAPAGTEHAHKLLPISRPKRPVRYGAAGGRPRRRT